MPHAQVSILLIDEEGLWAALRRLRRLRRGLHTYFAMPPSIEMKVRLEAPAW